MKVYLDRRVCEVWEAACETDLAWHIEHDTYCPACLTKIADPEDTQEVAIHITDRDGSEKTLLVNEDNKPKAIESWMLLWEKQQREQ